MDVGKPGRDRWGEGVATGNDASGRSVFSVVKAQQEGGRLHTKE